MVERRILTESFVNSVKPPEKGERWIADTKQKGFGLRLWANKSGGYKAYAIRIADINGRMIRKSFDIENRKKFILWVRGKFQLGDCLEAARRWARDEIDELKGRLTINEERIIYEYPAELRIKKITLGRAAESLISGLRLNGRSQAYVDSLDKLFNRYISKDLQNCALYRLSTKKLAKSLVNQEMSFGNIRTLRSFIGQIYERAGVFYPTGRKVEILNEHIRKEMDKYDVQFPELRKLKPSDYEIIFKILEKEENQWQQALCIRSYFIFSAALSRVMSATWSRIYKEFWYPYWPDEKNILV